MEQELNLAWSLGGRLIKVGGLGGLPPSRMEETSIQENHPWNKNILKLEVTISKE